MTGDDAGGKGRTSERSWDLLTRSGDGLDSGGLGESRDTVERLGRGGAEGGRRLGSLGELLRTRGGESSRCVPRLDDAILLRLGLPLDPLDSLPLLALLAILLLRRFPALAIRIVLGLLLPLLLLQRDPRLLGDSQLLLLLDSLLLLGKTELLLLALTLLLLDLALRLALESTLLVLASLLLETSLLDLSLRRLDGFSIGFLAKTFLLLLLLLIPGNRSSISDAPNKQEEEWGRTSSCPSSSGSPWPS